MKTKYEKLLEKYGINDFHNDFRMSQYYEIVDGFRLGLSTEQVLLYTRKEFDRDQMIEVRTGFEYGLSFEQVSLYTRPDLHWIQMSQIRRMLMEEPFEEVKTKVVLMVLES